MTSSGCSLSPCWGYKRWQTVSQTREQQHRDRIPLLPPRFATALIDWSDHYFVGQSAHGGAIRKGCGEPTRACMVSTLWGRSGCLVQDLLHKSGGEDRATLQRISRVRDSTGYHTGDDRMPCGMSRGNPWSHIARFCCSSCRSRT
jgi:hypothetical protein